jgi:hypothetical protein
MGIQMNYKEIELKRTNINEWKTITVKIEDASFSKKQNNGSDFRINGKDVYISKVLVEKLPSSNR